MTRHQLLGISGSIRAGSYNTIILQTLADHLRSTATLTIFPIDALPHYNEDLDIEDVAAPVQALRDAIAASDGVIIATPEFNHGLPGVLKNALDWASRPYCQAALTGKDVLTITSSPGGIGGARAHAQLNETLSSMASRVVLRPQAVIPFVNKKIEGGRLVDEASLRFLLAGVNDLIATAKRHRRVETEAA